MCLMYENIDDEAFIGRKQYSVCIYIYTYIHTYNLKHNAFLTHVTSFRLRTPRPGGLMALGVETPLRAL